MINTKTETPEGIEMNFATNTLGTFHLTNSLLDVLEKSAPSRVVTVSSGGMLTMKLDVSDLNSSKGKFDGTFVYAQNKVRRHPISC
jgi:dehydrogenase/reductase SDR family protein 12